jgi:RNA polymerase sigma factor (sigma-70 family)
MPHDKHDQKPTDEELLYAWRSGNKLAGAELFDRYHRPIASFLANKVGVDESEDLVQRTFLGLVEGLDRFRGDASVRTLLYAIARNQLNEYLRNLTRDRERFDSGVTSLAAIKTTPTQALAAKDDERLLQLALRELALDTQLMFELHYWEGLSLAEVAEVLDMQPTAVRVRMHRGRKTLEAHMRRLAESKEQLESSLSSLSVRMGPDEG